MLASDRLVIRLTTAEKPPKPATGCPADQRRITLPNANAAPLRVLVWGENRHEQIEQHVRDIYPDGMHATIAAGISENLGDTALVSTTTLDEPEREEVRELVDA